MPFNKYLKIMKQAKAKYFKEFSLNIKINIEYITTKAIDEITKEAEKKIKCLKDLKQASINSYHATFKAVVNFGKEFKELERVINP